MAETVIWLLIAASALVGSGLLSLAYYAAWRRITTAPRLPIGEPVRIPAWANLRRELLRVAAQSLFFLTGALSVYQLAIGLVPHGRLVSITLLIVGQCCMALNSWADWQDDRRLIAAVDEWDQRYVAVPKDVPPTRSQMDRQQATRIGATGEESADRLRREGIGDERP